MFETLDSVDRARAIRQGLLVPCSYCGAASAWTTPQDQHIYCPAHLFIAQLKEAWWTTHGVPPPQATPYAVPL